jgi:hypothetical protein
MAQFTAISLAPSIWGCSNVAIMCVFSMFSSSFLQCSGLFVDSAFPHATPVAEDAEADDVQLFRSPDSRVQRPNVGSIAGGKQPANHRIFLEDTTHISRHHACRQTSM